MLHVTIMALVYYFKSRIRNQCLWYADSFWSLVVFQQGGNDAWQSECGTVQRMAKLCFLFRCTVADTLHLKAMDDAAEVFFLPLKEIRPEDFGLASIRKGLQMFLTGIS